MNLVKSCEVKSHLLESAVTISLYSESFEGTTSYSVIVKNGVKTLEYDGTNKLKARVVYANMVMDYSGANLP